MSFGQGRVLKKKFYIKQASTDITSPDKIVFKRRTCYIQQPPEVPPLRPTPSQRSSRLHNFILKEIMRQQANLIRTKRGLFSQHSKGVRQKAQPIKRKAPSKPSVLALHTPSTSDWLGESPQHLKKRRNISVITCTFPPPGLCFTFCHDPTRDLVSQFRSNVSICEEKMRRRWRRNLWITRGQLCDLESE